MRFKKLFVVYFILLALAVTGMAILWQTKKETVILPRDFEEIKQEGVLRLITEYNQSGYYVSGDTIEGFQYELAQAIAQVSGLEVQIQLEMTLSKSFEELVAQRCDVIARNIPVTIETRELYLFTDPIVLNKQVLVQRSAHINENQSPIRNQLDLAGKTLYIPEHSPALLRLRHLEHEIGDTIYIIEEPLYSSEQLIILVAEGEIDYAVCDQQIALKSKKQFPDIDIETDISFTQLQSWAVRKDSPVLLDSLNAWLRGIRESGIYQQIHKRYYQ